MWRTVLKSKIHGALVTQCELDYEGSITIDQDLLEAADLWVGEKVQIVNKNNGQRFETYTIPGERGSGMIGLNGPAALLAEEGHVIHIISYQWLDNNETPGDPTVLILGQDNQILERK